MSANWFEILQTVFRDGTEGAAIRQNIIETVRQHVHSMGSELEKTIRPAPAVVEEEEIFAESESEPKPRYTRSEKKRFLKKAHRIKELLSKPVALQEDEPY